MSSKTLIVPLALGAAAVVGLTTAGLRLASRGAAPVAPATPPETSPAPVPVVSATPDDGRVARLVALAPELNDQSAALLVRTESPNLPDLKVAEAALAIAAAGYSRLDSGELRELGELFDSAYATLAPSDREWMGVYIERVRSGDVGPEESVRGRALLTRAVGALPAPRRARLQAALQRAIAAGLAGREQAERRTREAALAPPVPWPSTPAAPESSGTVMARASTEAPRLAADSSGRSARPDGGGYAGPQAGEAYWRSRMSAARTRVAQLEAEVQRLDEQATRTAYGSSSTEVCGKPRIRDKADEREIEDCLRRVQNEPLRKQAERGRILSQLDAARSRLAQARRALENLEEQARRQGALPGWLRD